MMTEKITINPDGTWDCLCGNTEIDDGFYPCDYKGTEVEPTEELWDGERLVCGRCTRVINQHTGVVSVGPDE